MGGVEPQDEHHCIWPFFLRDNIFSYLEFLDISLGPLKFTDFTGDLRLVALVAKEFYPTLDTMNLQLVTFEIIQRGLHDSIQTSCSFACMKGRKEGLRF